MANDKAREKTFEIRDAHWASIGKVDNDVIGHAISPQLMGGPAWPTTRQAYRVIRLADGSIIVATDGMSDPYDDEDAPAENGFGMELFVHTKGIDPAHASKPGDVSRITKSWAFELLSHVAGTVADAGGIMPQLQKHGVLSMELPGVSQSSAIAPQLPKHFFTDDDSIGILLGTPVQGFSAAIADMPLSPVTLVPITVVTAEELAQLREGGAAARKKLVDQRLASGVGHTIALG